MEGKPLKSILQSPYAPANDEKRRAIRIKFKLTPEQEEIADWRPYRSTYPAMKKRRDERRRLLRRARAAESIENATKSEGDVGGQVNDVTMSNMEDDEDDDDEVVENETDDDDDEEEKGRNPIVLNEGESLEDLFEEDENYVEDDGDYPRRTRLSIEELEEGDALDEQVDEEEEMDEEEHQGSSSLSPIKANEIGVVVNDDQWLDDFMNRWQSVIKLEIKWEGSGSQCGMWDTGHGEVTTEN